MATLFPTGVDAFANPAALKVDGVDLVRAAHVNDLQDSVIAIENFIITPGSTFAWSVTQFPDDTPIVDAIRALDAAIDTDITALATHIGLVLPTDPTQHHANVIAVTAGGNLTSDRVQAALEEHQGDIDNIMIGGSVNGVTLDDRYVGKTGNHTMAGSLVIQTDLQVDGNTIIGDAGTDTLTINAAITALAGMALTGDLTITTGNALVDDQQYFGSVDEYSSVFFNGDDTQLRARGDVILWMDADDLVDAGAEARFLRVKDGLGADVMTVDESGNMVLIGDLTAVDLTVTNLVLGSSTHTDGSMKTDSVVYQVDLDNNADETGERFVITKNNDPGTTPSSADFLFEVDENARVLGGNYVLKPGIQETGFFGLRTSSPAPGNIFYGTGVNFKSVMSNGPSSITLTPTVDINTQSVSVVYSDVYGFFIELASVASGDVQYYGTYTTVGN